MTEVWVVGNRLDTDGCCCLVGKRTAERCFPTGEMRYLSSGEIAATSDECYAGILVLCKKDSATILALAKRIATLLNKEATNEVAD